MLAKGEILEGKPGSFASEPYDLYTLGLCPASSIYLTLQLGPVICKPGCPWAKLPVPEPKFWVFSSVLRWTTGCLSKAGQTCLKSPLALACPLPQSSVLYSLIPLLTLIVWGHAFGHPEVSEVLKMPKSWVELLGWLMGFWVGPFGLGSAFGMGHLLTLPWPQQPHPKASQQPHSDLE